MQHRFVRYAGFFLLLVVHAACGQSTPLEQQGQSGNTPEAEVGHQIARLQTVDDAVVEEVADALIAYETGLTVPALVEATKASDALTRTNAVKVLCRVATSSPRALAHPDVLPALVENLYADEPRVRSAAIQSLGSLGAPAVPILLAALAEDDERSQGGWFASKALGLIGVASLPDLISLLKDGNEKTRTAAAVALRYVEDPSAGDALPTLINALQSKPWQDPWAGYQTVAVLGGRTGAPELLDALQDDAPGLHAAARQALIDSGDLAKPLEPALRELLQAEDIRTQCLAAEILWMLSKDTPAVLPVLIRALEDESADIRLMAAYMVARVGPQAKQAIPVLRRVMNDPDAEIRRNVATALGMMGPDAQDAIPALLAGLADAQFASVYDNAIRAIGPPSLASVGELIELAGGGHPLTTWRVVDALRQLGPAASVATDALTALAKSDDAVTRILAEETLHEFAGGDVETNWPSFKVVATVTSEETMPTSTIWFHRGQALEMTDGIGSDPEVIYDLSYMKWRDFGARREIDIGDCVLWGAESAAKTLESLGEETDEATRSLVKSLLTPSLEVQERADLLVLFNDVLRFELTTQPLPAEQCRSFLAYDRLNAYRKAILSRELPPYPQLAVTDELVRRGVAPRSIRITATIPGQPVSVMELAIGIEPMSVEEGTRLDDEFLP